MTNYKIRPVTEEDIPFLWDMLYESLYVPEGGQPFAREIIQEPFMAKYVQEWGRDGDLGYIAVDDNNSKIGSITARCFTADHPGFGYVADNVPELGMAILPAYCGQGIGTALMTSLMDELRARGVKQVSLSVAPENTAAMKLYQKFGFYEVGMVDTSLTMVSDL